MRNKLLSCCYVVIMSVTGVILFCISFCVWLLTVLFDRRLVYLHLFGALWARFYLWLLPVGKVTVEGREKLAGEAPCIIVSNHQSQLDILVAFQLFVPFKWISKIEVFRIPFIGWYMMLNRYIPLKRGDRDSIRQMMAHCEKTLREGCSIFMFPEGTRSPSGLLRPFKPGAFILARKQKLPIVPVVVNGTRNALPKNSLVVRENRDMTLTVLDKIPYEAYGELSVKETAEMVRELIKGHVAEHCREDDPEEGGAAVGAGGR